MPANTIQLPLNQQQRELLERTIAQGHAADLQSLVRRALREYRAPVAQPARPVPESAP